MPNWLKLNVDNVSSVCTFVTFMPQPTAMTNAISRSPAALYAWLSFNNTNFDYDPVQVTLTQYDVVSDVTQLTAPAIPANPVTFAQQSYTLRNRVSYTQYYDVLHHSSAVVGGVTIYTPQYYDYTSGTYYAYDIHGNVDTLLHHYRQGAMADHGYNRFKEIAYKYDLISGKVNEVHYQPGAIDQFYHRYEYDAENRITDVYTTDHKAWLSNKSLEEHEAFYTYYRHGPLARSVIGQQQVQGLDYAYTLQGWLKGVNSTSLNATYDMGGDGSFVARDAYSYSLNYFTGDYKAINTTVSPFPGFSGMMPAGYYKPLYNGNISAMTVNIGKFNSPLLYNYQYDQLNRLIQMDAMNALNESANSWGTITALSDYHESIDYDANGNIKTYLRNGTVAGGNPSAMDDLTYHYNLDGNGHLANNKLTSVSDAVAAGNYTNDIDNQSANNYDYDAIGNLIQDAGEGITNISWTVYGKISLINKSDGTTISYTYDAAGNRISKTVTPAGGSATTTWYVRDASGNVMAVYAIEGSSIAQTEQHLYGSSRLGIYGRNINADASLPTGTPANLIGNYFESSFIRGNKNYELSNHLGNVLVTVSDKKFGTDTDGDGLTDYYTADVVSANDYYPGGMDVPGRNFGTQGRYGFNGKERDKEAVQYDYGFRIYDPRLVRFKSVDPLTKSYPWLTPYQFSGNNPIRFIDLDGLEVANPSIFRTALNAISGNYHLNRMNKYLTANNLTSENVIELNNETSVVFQIKKNEATGTNQTIYSVFRKARQGRDCLLCVQSGKDDDIGLTENEFLNTTVLSARVMDAPIGIGSASKAAALINGGKNSYYSIRQFVGSARQGLRSLGNWKREIGFGKPDALGISGDLITKGFHLHFNSLKGLELGLTTTSEGKLGLTFLRGEGKSVEKAIKLFSQAMENKGFRSELLVRLKASEEALTDATKMLQSGSRDLKNAENSLNEVKSVINSIRKNYGGK